MNHIDLFSGIGGFAYAAKQVWGNEYQNLFFCDTDKFCQEVLKKNFGKDSLIYGDIRKVKYEKFIEDSKRIGCLHGKSEKEGTEIREQRIVGSGNEVGICNEEIITNGEENDNTTTIANSYKRRGNGNESKTENAGYDKRYRVDLLTGGFPCQPFSAAGARKGREDDRHLWPQMFRVIQDFEPTWVIAENVRGLLNIEGGMAFEQVCLDLESANYEVQTFVVPAVAVNAPHRRDRIWIIAHRIGVRCGGGMSEREGGNAKQPFQVEEKEQNGYALRSEVGGCNRGSSKISTYSEHDGGDGTEIVGKDNGTQSEKKTGKKLLGNESSGGNSLRSEEVGRSDVGNSESSGQQSSIDGQGENKYGGTSSTGTEQWEQDWLEVATKFCRMDDGLPVELDGFKLTKSGHRVERLKSLGNAIVPQVAMQFMTMIKYVESLNIQDEQKVENKNMNYVKIDDVKGRYMVTKDLRNFGAKEKNK